MRKYFYGAAMSLICMVIMAGCGQKTVTHTDEYESETEVSKEKNENMPEIVFDYTFIYEYKEPYSYTYMFIDRYGNIYAGDSEAYFCTAEEKMNLYETLINTSACKKINIIDAEQLQKTYDLLQQMIEDGENEVSVEESELDVCLGQYRWSGYCYDEDGKLKVVTLYGEGDTSYINNDIRAKEMADWITDLKVQ